MEYAPLLLDGIENKIKKLIFTMQQLKEENDKLRNEMHQLQNEVAEKNISISGLEEKMNKLKVSKVLAGEDTMQARQQINQLLREIDKCYSLLNR